MNILNIYKIIKKELKLNTVNYWIFLSASIIVILNLIVIYFAEIISGDYSQTDIRSLLLSIIHLQMYLIPLLSFVLSYDSILSEKETGIFDLILSYRISLIDVFLGKLLGNTLIFTLSFFLGIIPVCVYLYILGVNINTLLTFFIISVWLSFVFNGMALYISNLSKDRTVVILLSIFVWLFFIFIYDILFTFLAIFSYGKISNDILSLILLINPAEIFRIISILYFMPNDANELFGINSTVLNFWTSIIFVSIWSIGIIYTFTYIHIKNKI